LLFRDAVRNPRLLDDDTSSHPVSKQTLATRQDRRYRLGAMLLLG
jgi:hypothetical protein